MNSAQGCSGRSTRLLLVLSVALASLALDQPRIPKGSNMETTTKETGPACPTSNSQWRTWRDQELSRLADGRYEANARYIAAFFTKCRPALKAAPQAARCMANLQAFTRHRLLEKTPGHSLGFELTDEAYLASVPAPALFTLPDVLRRQDFLRALDQDSEKERQVALAILDRYNKELEDPSTHLSYVIFRSQDLPTPDESLARTRLLVRIPHGDYQQFVQFGLRDHRRQPLAQSVSLIAVQTSDLGTHLPLPRPKVYFNDLFRLRHSGTIIYGNRLRENKGRLERCTSCHQTPVLPISPDEGFDSAKFGHALADMNAHIEELQDAVAAEEPAGADGPALADHSTGNPDDTFMQHCAAVSGVGPESLARVRDAMNCAECHNGQNRGPLTRMSVHEGQLPLGGNMVKRAVLSDRSMPPGVALSDAEREALYACLQTEYLGNAGEHSGQLWRWLAQEDCSF